MDDPKLASDATEEGLQKEREKEKDYTQSSPEISTGDTDAGWEESDTNGTELPGGGNETPDEADVEEIGKATGESYEPGEPLDPTKKEGS